MKEPKIIITEADVVGNKGAVAMVNCIIKGVQKYYPNAHFIVTSKFIKDAGYLDSNEIEILYDGEQAFDIPLVKIWIWWLFNKFGIKLNGLLNDYVIKKFMEADLVVSASGISFNDNFGFIKIYHFTKYLQIPLFLNKKIVKFTQTIGPFESSYNKLIAKLVLEQIDFIMPRGRHSLENLNKISVTNKVESFPDIAMTMEPQISIRAEKILQGLKPKTIIGFSPNIVCKRLDKSGQYIPALKSLLKHIITNYKDSHIVFIPHTIEKSNLNKDDDMNICNELANEIKDYSSHSIVNTLDYTPEEIKWLISKCDFFIGSRFHSLIASISSSVPSIAIGWHWKYNEMMEWVDLDGNVIQYWELNSKKLINLFEHNFNRRENVKSKLGYKNVEIKAKANKAIEILVGVLDENS